MTRQGSDEASDDALVGVLQAKLQRSDLADGQQLLVVVAFDGAEALEQVVQGVVDSRSPQARRDSAKRETQQAFLGTVTVRAFRGIGAEASLPLEPGPGLTLILGRNGSGKSTFADGIETALTGTSFRWKDKTKDWKRDWRNLHEDAEPSIVLELALDGVSGHTTVQRTWKGEDVDKSQGWVRQPGGQWAPLADLGWVDALATNRPFLSYSELGQTIAGRPSDMYDALASILGLEEITAAEKRLNDVRKRLDASVKALSSDLPPLLAELAGVDDERARIAHGSLIGPTRRLDDAAAVLGDSTESELASERVAQLRQLAGLTHPDRDNVAEAYKSLRQAAREVETVRGTATEDARDLADLLDRALRHHDRHEGEERCPLCGSEDVLDERWADRTRARVMQLRTEATQAEAADRRAASAIARTRGLIGQPPPWFAGRLVRVGILDGVGSGHRNRRPGRTG